MKIEENTSFLSEINVTPFVDVMLVLLIIFMVTAPMMTQGVEVNLPKAKTVSTLPEETDNVVVSLKKDGLIFVDTYKVSLDELEDFLKKHAKNKKMIFLKADKDVSYGVVIDVMSRVKSAGIDKLGVIVQKEDK
ncbi:protein TolR [Desulfonauticus submarinus]|uniref:Cell division and transport-associated protein TolR (TC 2.C.1.2.1) n=1 Tax=Desulfonauticus submarinus TaxID=206665 RepID=A0A1G9ZKV8_9BACT|nr:protein TolR [Desulfonauticus submarinus]SDN21163.1 Cell division and transport-associated protein TolR (TC 2.C.1.2.1) [Desulfonauticus submarinus]